MRLDDEGESGNVEDRRGLGPVAIGGGGLGAVVLALIGYFVFGVSPSQMTGGAPPGAQQQGRMGAPSDPQGAFAAKVLKTTEDVWSAKFQAVGQTYDPPTLVLYEEATTTACGFGQAAMGPFYCPPDRRVYLDLSFFRELDQRFGAPGQAARAYVIAHEVGHHVQNLLGISDQARRAEQAAGSRAGANRISVKTELQADCFAGVWARASGRLDPADIEQAMTAAAAVGDDRLQRETQGVVVPDSFTHGSSADRQKWFMTGYKSGDPNACDTFGTGVGFGRTVQGGASEGE
jgi:hypothetical protein